MRALVLSRGEAPAVREVPDPEPGPGEALVGVLLAGICRTDLELARGYMDFAGIPGHEFVGRVERVTSRADGPLVGARVTSEINLGCLECSWCVQGLARHCPDRRVLGILGKDGAFAERVALPVSALRAVPATLSDRRAIFVEPTAAAFAILDQVGVSSSSSVLVLGDGKLGLLAAQALALRGARVTVAGRHPAKLALARSWGLRAEQAEGLAEAGFDMVVECTGRPEGLDLALRRVRPRGTVVMKTTCAGGTTFDAARAVVDEVTLVGSRCGRFEPALEALSGGAVQVDGLIAEELPLARAAEALRLAGESHRLKVILRVAP